MSKQLDISRAPTFSRQTGGHRHGKMLPDRNPLRNLRRHDLRERHCARVPALSIPVATIHPQAMCFTSPSTPNVMSVSNRASHSPAPHPLHPAEIRDILTATGQRHD